MAKYIQQQCIEDVMQVTPIKTEADNKAALSRIELLWDAEPNTPEADELVVLATLVETFEETHYLIAPPDPVEAIKFRMEQQGLEDKDLIKFLGTPSRVTEVLKRQRRLTINMVRNLHVGLRIPLETLVRDYELVK